MKKLNSVFVRGGIIVSSLMLFAGGVNAALVNINVTVGNAAPTITTHTLETPASYAGAPTNNDGSNVTFTGTGTDVNGDQYYLLICKTNGAPTANSNAAPTCNGGGSNQLCVSATTNSATAASCAHSVAAEAAQTQTWYAFVCDYSTSSACSAVDSTGATDADSPYYINHAPTFSTTLAAASALPAGTFTYTVPSANWTGGAGDGDQGKLLVCSTNSITAGGACTATQLCASAFTNEGTALTCSFNAAAVVENGTFPAYTFIVDTHNMPATGTGQGYNATYIVLNATPVVSNVVVNGGVDITLNPSPATKSIVITSTISDANSCQDLAATPETAKMYLSPSVGAGACTVTTSTNCYLITAVNCVQAGANTCDSATDGSVDYSCTAVLQFFTDPSDQISALYNTWYADTWKATATATDLQAAAGSFESATGVEVNTLSSMSIGGSIAYGSLSPGVASGGGLVNIPLVMTNLGNVGLNAETKGNGTALCTDYPTCAGSTIPFARQKWEYLNNTTTWTSSSNVLTNSVLTITLGITKPVSAVTPSKSIYWGLSVPGGQAYGTYTGENTVNNLTSAPGTW